MTFQRIFLKRFLPESIQFRIICSIEHIDEHISDDIVCLGNSVHLNLA